MLSSLARQQNDRELHPTKPFGRNCGEQIRGEKMKR
jgi:hypothetical protein